MEEVKIYANLNFNNAFSIITSLSLFICLCVLFKRFNSFSDWYESRKRKPPGPIGLPFVGYLPFLGKDPHKTFWNMRKKYGDVISIYLGPKYTIVLNSYQATKEVLNHPGSLDRAPDIFKHINNIGFMTENGSRWIEQRRFSMSTAKKLGLGEGYWKIIITEELSKLITTLRETKGKPFDISVDLLTSLNTNILTLLIGRRFGKDEVDKIRLSEKFSKDAVGTTSASNPTTLIPGLRKFLQTFKIYGHDQEKETFCQFSSFIKEEIRKHKTSELFQDTPDFINSYLHKLSELSKNDKKDHAFSESMLEGNLVVLFLGTSDTVFSSLEWLIRIMCKYPDVQEKVNKELVKTFGKDGQVTYEERDKIPYTFSVIMEGQRYASNVPLSITRVANQDIPINEYIIPKGSEITPNLWALHHDPAYWDEPDEFRPERFLMDGGTKLIKNPPSYAPFSLGKRNCPGEVIAWMEILYYFSEIIRKFKISTPLGVEPLFETVNALVTTLASQPLCFKERDI